MTDPLLAGSCRMRRSLRGGFAYRLKSVLKKYYVLYLFLLPALIHMLFFRYIPMYGVQIAFKDFSPVLGITGSPFVGFKHFQKFFDSYRFTQLLGNTLTLSVYSLVASFPIPILLALLLNYCPSKRLKQLTQTVTYAPHFISMVVLVGMLTMMLSPSSGIINRLLSLLGVAPVYFMGKESCFKHVYVWSEIWQNAGWNSIIFIASLANVSPEQHEAAIIDGGNKLQRMIYIDLPVIFPIAVTMLILSTGNILNVGFEKVLLMQNDLVLNTSEIISTYTYKAGLVNNKFSYASAIGLFNNGVNLICLLCVNTVANKTTGNGLW